MSAWSACIFGGRSRRGILFLCVCVLVSGVLSRGPLDQFWALGIVGARAQGKGVVHSPNIFPREAVSSAR